MKNNFKNWDKERLKQVSSRGGKVKSRAKSRAAKLRLRARIINHVKGYRYDGMVDAIIDELKFYNKPLVINC
jgi:hypothetical protein